MKPDSSRDRVSPLRRLTEHVDQSQHPPSTWVLIVACLVLGGAFGFIFLAIWTEGSVSEKFASSGAALLGLSVALAIIGSVWKGVGEAPRK